MQTLGTNFRLLRFMTWTGPVVIITFLVSAVLVGFIPPPSPSGSAEEIAGLFRENSTGIRVACILMMIAITGWATFGMAITTMLRKTERGLPVITYTSTALVGACTVFFEMVPMTWAVAAYRPDEVEPAVTRMANDWTWFNFLFTLPPFAAWFLLIAVAIFKDQTTPALYPRWVGYVNVWLSIFALPAMLIALFKTGPFAWNGIGAFWIPMAIFTTWFGVMTVTTLQAITREQAGQRAVSDEFTPTPGP